MSSGGGGGGGAAGSSGGWNSLLSVVEAPPAEAPTAPESAALDRLTGGPPSFSSLGTELEASQAAARRLQESTAAGRRLVFLASSKLQRSDLGGARAALDSALALVSPQEAAGKKLWCDREARLRLSEAAGFAHFVSGYISCRGFLSFLEGGVLTPEMPQSLRIGAEDVDDERYIIGVIEASRELERYALNRGKALDLASIQICLRTVQSLEQALMQFDFRNSDVRRRFDGVKYVVKKLETLAYEVDLAQKRGALSSASSTAGDGAAAPPPEAGASEPPAKRAKVEGSEPPRLALDLNLLNRIKERYDHFDSMREQTLKRSRDVIKAAKNAISALQRDDLKRADNLLNQCSRDAGSIYKELVARSPSHRCGAFGAALEELAEALAYRAFRRERRLLGRSELQEASGLPFSFTLPEYLGGIMDLTGEVGRHAVRSAAKGRPALPEVELCLACVDSVYSGLQELPQLPGGIGKKMGPLKGTLIKIEGVLYELALLSKGGLAVRAPPPTNFEFSGGGDADGGAEAGGDA